MNLNFTAEQLKKWAELRDLDAIILLYSYNAN